MNQKIRTAYSAELVSSREALRVGDVAGAWRHLERAHILSQQFALEHVAVHLRMFALGLRTLDWREILGQVPRIMVAAPGSLLGKAPRGNTGRANVGIMQPMEIPEDLTATLNGLS